MLTQAQCQTQCRRVARLARMSIISLILFHAIRLPA